MEIKNIEGMPILTDLVEKAQKDKQAALSLFKQKYDSIAFVLSTNNEDKESYCINLMDGTIEFKKYNFFRKFIKIFGALVKDLLIKFDDLTTLNLTWVYNFICKHCISLEKLKFEYDEDGDFEPMMERSEFMVGNPIRITTGFPSLEYLFAKNVYFKSKMKMNVCFPNLRALVLVDSAFKDSSMVEVNMPHLMSLCITEIEAMDFDSDYSDDDECGEWVDVDSDYSDDDGPVCDDSDGSDSSHNDDDDEGDSIKNVDRENAENMIRLNPQLETIKIDLKMDTLFIKFLRDSLPSLRKLSLSIESWDFHKYNGAAIVFKNVAVFDFDDMNEITRVPPITSENLTHLILSTGDNTFALDFIKKHRSVKTLDLECDYNVTQVLRLVESLPDLKAINLSIKGEWTPTDVNRILGKCKRFDKAKLTVNVQASRGWSSLANTWEINVDDFSDAHIFEKKTKP